MVLPSRIAFNRLSSKSIILQNRGSNLTFVTEGSEMDTLVFSIQVPLLASITNESFLSGHLISIMSLPFLSNKRSNSTNFPELFKRDSTQRLLFSENIEWIYDPFFIGSWRKDRTCSFFALSWTESLFLEPVLACLTIHDSCDIFTSQLRSAW